MRMERQHSRNPFSMASPGNPREIFKMMYIQHTCGHETQFQRQKQNMVLAELNGLWADNKAMEY